MPSVVEAPDDARLKLKRRDTSGITYSITICLASEIGQLGLGCEGFAPRGCQGRNWICLPMESKERIALAASLARPFTPSTDCSSATVAAALEGVRGVQGVQ
jgi:hypothetical protein